MYYDDKDPKTLSSTVFIFLAIAGLFLVIIEGFFLKICISFFNVQVPFYPYMLFALVAMFGASFNLIPLRSFRLTYRSSTFLFYTTTFIAIDSICSLIMVCHFHLGAIGKIYGNCISTWVMAILYSVAMIRENGISIDWIRIKKAFKFSIPLLPGAYAIVAQTMVDRIILERFETIAKIGIYSIAFLLATSVNTIINAVFFVIEPKIYQIYKQADFIQQFIQLKKYLFLLVGLLVGCFVFFSRQIVFVLLGSSYMESGSLIPIICFSSFIMLGVNLYQQLILLKNRTKTMSSISIISASLGVGLNLILIPILGNYGAAITISSSALIGYVICLYIIRKAYKGDFFINHEISIGVLLLLSYPLIISIDKYSIWTTFPLKIVLFCVFVVILLKVLKIKSIAIKSYFINVLQP